MDKKRILLKDIAKVDPFKTPEGYFGTFTNGIMSQLPDVAPEDPQNITLWQRIHPWVYMAAMFAGIALMIRLFTGVPASLGIKEYTPGEFNLTSLSDIEDFYLYYEDGLAQLVYEDTFYVTDLVEEIDSE